MVWWRTGVQDFRKNSSTAITGIKRLMYQVHMSMSLSTKSSRRVHVVWMRTNGAQSSMSHLRHDAQRARFPYSYPACFTKASAAALQVVVAYSRPARFAKPSCCLYDSSGITRRLSALSAALSGCLSTTKVSDVHYIGHTYHYTFLKDQ